MDILRVAKEDVGNNDKDFSKGFAHSHAFKKCNLQTKKKTRTETIESTSFNPI